MSKSRLPSRPGKRALPALDSVRVPPAFEPIFLRAQDYVRRYFADRVESPEHSTISISGERYVLVRAASMSVEFFDLVTSLYRDEGAENARAVASNLLFDLAHALGRADARSFQKKMGVSDPLDKLSAGPIHFAFAGWAFVDILPESRPSPDQNYFLVYDHPFSFESDAWVTRGRASDVPVCIMNAGYSSGWCEESFGLPLVAAEVECLAAGDPRCRFVMAPPGRIEEHLARLTGIPGTALPRAGATRVKVPEFFQRKRLEDEVRRHQENLERRVEDRTAELLRTNELLRDEIGERKRTEQQLRLLGSAVEHADEGIVILRKGGPDGAGPRIAFVNDGFYRTTGLTSEEVVGRTLRVLEIEPADRLAEEALQRSLASARPYRGEMSARRKGGAPYALELHAMPVEDVVEGVTHWIAILRDVSERRAQVAALEHQALHDALTDLPNRVLLRDRLEQALLAAGRSGTAVALFFMDLDRFKEVNDTFGHHSGDQLLRQVGTRLKQELRASDSIARLGGDEFGVLLPLLDGSDAAVQTARKILRALEQPFLVEGQSLDIGASVGIALFPEHGSDAAALMKHADVAMYVAKRSGGGYAVYDAVEDPRDGGLALLGELKQALERSQIVLAYQPLVRLDGTGVERMEALACWEHPRLGRLPPERFASLSDQSGLASAFTAHVLALASRQCRAWHEEGVALGVSVNVAARSLSDPQLAERVAGILSAERLEARWLTLEIADGGTPSGNVAVPSPLRDLRAAGVTLSLDGFGARSASLSQLRHVPAGELKVDASLVRELARSGEGDAIVRSVVELGHRLGCRVAAAGVEDEATWSRLAALGCDLAQGDLLSPPLAAADVAAWVRGRSGV